MRKALILSIVIPVLIVGATLGAFYIWVDSNRERIHRMETDCMRPTLQPGDFLLVSPKAPNEIKAAPKPEGDIIVFRNPLMDDELPRTGLLRPYIVLRAVDKAMSNGLWFFKTESDATNGAVLVWTGPDTWQGMVSERLLIGVVIAHLQEVWVVYFGVILLLIVILPPIGVAIYLRARHPHVSKSRTPPLPPAENFD